MPVQLRKRDCSSTRDWMKADRRSLKAKRRVGRACSGRHESIWEREEEDDLVAGLDKEEDSYLLHGLGPTL